MIKQVIVVRKDLNMRKGKMCAQAAHASMKVFFDRMSPATYEKIEHDFTEEYRDRHYTYFTPEMVEWMNGSFTKIVVSCDSEEELYQIQKRCSDKRIPCALIVDNGATEFNGVKTPTCIAVGPADSNLIDEITGNLQLL